MAQLWKVCCELCSEEEGKCCGDECCADTCSLLPKHVSEQQQEEIALAFQKPDAPRRKKGKRGGHHHHEGHDGREASVCGEAEEGRHGGSCGGGGDDCLEGKKPGSCGGGGHGGHDHGQGLKKEKTKKRGDRHGGHGHGHATAHQEGGGCGGDGDCCAEESGHRGEASHDDHGHAHAEGGCCSGGGDAPKPLDQSAGGTTISVSVTGVTCSDCALRVEKKLLKQKGVLAVSISSVTQRADVHFDEAVIKDVDIQKCIQDMGFGAQLLNQSAAARLILRVAEKPQRGDETDYDYDYDYGCDDAVPLRDVEEPVLPMADVVGKLEDLPGVALVGHTKKRKKGRVFYVVAIDYDPDQVGARLLVSTVQGCGYATQLVAEKDATKKKTSNQKEVRRLATLFTVSAVLGVPVLLLAFVFPQIDEADDALDTEIVRGLSIGVFIEWVLTTPIQFVVGYPLYVSAFRSLWYTKKANVDTLVVLSTTVAYGYSVITTILAMSLPDYESTPFFDTSAILLMLIMLGRLLESITRRKTSDVLTKLLELQADSTTLLHKQGEDVIGEEEIAIELVQKGDVLKVLPGAKVPLDGVVVFGSSSIDESMVRADFSSFSSRAPSSESGRRETVVGRLLFHAHTYSHPPSTPHTTRRSRENPCQCPRKWAAGSLAEPSIRTARFTWKRPTPFPTACWPPSARWSSKRKPSSPPSSASPT